MTDIVQAVAADDVRNENDEPLDTVQAGTVWRIPDTGDVPYAFGNLLGREIGRVIHISYGQHLPEMDAIYMEVEDGRRVSIERRHLLEGNEWDQLARIARVEEVNDYAAAMKSMVESIDAWRAARDRDNEWITGGEIVTLVNFPWFEELHGRVMGEPHNLVEGEEARWLLQFARRAGEEGLEDAIMSDPEISRATARVVSPPREEGGSFHVEVLSTTDNDVFCLGNPDEISGWYEVVRRVELPE